MRLMLPISSFDSSPHVTRTGGLEVHGVTWTIEGNKTLLDNISMSARPGTLTAVIGPSGAGKSTFARLVAGYTHPTTGTVSFEGHDIHAEYACALYIDGAVKPRPAKRLKPNRHRSLPFRFCGSVSWERSSGRPK